MRQPTKPTQLVVLFAFQAVLATRFAAPSANEELLRREEIIRVNPDFFKAVSFGHWAMTLDWQWLQVLQDDSMKKVQPGQHPPLYYKLDLITDIDPAFYDAYHAGAHLLAVVRNDGLGARDLLLKAVSAMKSQPIESPWSIYLLLAYVNLFELQNLPDAAESFRQAAAQPGSPSYLGHLVERLSRPDGQFEVGTRLLKFMASAQTVPSVRAELEEKYATLEWRWTLWKIQQVARKFKSWDLFLKAHPETPRVDPWGGEVRLDETGRVTSTTERGKVLGL